VSAHTWPERISVGIDGSPDSRVALRWAVAHARAGDSITLVHVWSASPAMVDAGICEPDDDSAARSLAHRELLRARELLDDPNVELHSLVLHGEPRHALCELDTDLLVLGSDGRRGVVGRLLGSVSQHVLGHASIPVVLVPTRPA
jgi:nucleotide-binding universal stress UspA family protein